MPLIPYCNYLRLWVCSLYLCNSVGFGPTEKQAPRCAQGSSFWMWMLAVQSTETVTAGVRALKMKKITLEKSVETFHWHKECYPTASPYLKQVSTLRISSSAFYIQLKKLLPLIPLSQQPMSSPPSTTTWQSRRPRHQSYTVPRKRSSPHC